MAINDKFLIDKLTSAIENNLPKTFLEQEQKAKARGEVEIMLGRSRVYDGKFNALVKAYEKEKRKKLEFTKLELNEFGKWLVAEKMPSVSAKTWTLYKSALKAVVPDKAFIDIISVSSVNRKADIVKRSSSKRVKSMPDQIFAQIRARIDKTNSKYADVTNRLFFVVRKFGIRPSEIMDSQIVEYKGFKFLKVKSLKKDNHIYMNEEVSNRYPYRYIPTLHLSDDELDYVKTTIASFSAISTQEIFDALYEGIRKLFLFVCDKLHLNSEESSYSIYSARQQFSADLKATQLNNLTRIKIMSHNEENTLKNFYGRKSLGKPLFAPNENYEKLLNECFDKQI